MTIMRLDNLNPGRLASLRGVARAPAAVSTPGPEPVAEPEPTEWVQPKRHTSGAKEISVAAIEERPPGSPGPIGAVALAETAAASAAEPEPSKRTPQATIPDQAPAPDTRAADASPSDRLLTPDEVAARLSVTAKTLERWRAMGEGPDSVRLSRKVLRYTNADVEAFIRRCTVANTART